MRLCFVIQPFDAGPFDARYDGTLVPAIRAAGFEPYRVDRDKSVAVPVTTIELKVRSADVCVADITDDNPNVWLELGLAIAANKPVLLLAKEPKRKTFPFDVQHRHIVRYRTDSERDFQTLRSEITERLPGIAGASDAASLATTKLSSLDEALREETRRFEDLRSAIDSLQDHKNAVFARLKLIFDIRANRAYENVNDADLASEIHLLARKEATQFARQYGLEAEWREWMRRQTASKSRRRSRRTR